MTFRHFKRNAELQMIAQKIQEADGRAFLVGGCVRDAFLNIASKDIDVEVFNIEKDVLLNILNSFGRVDNVGESFEVIKLTTETQDFDFSFPRREVKTGIGHKGFETVADPFMAPEEAAKRRDFTINALMVDVATLELFDFFGGVDDLENRILKHTSRAFAEDPLRVLRAMQFASRFNLDLHPETVELCKKLKSEFHTISKERIGIEFEKLFSKGINPSKGIKALFQTEWSDCFKGLFKPSEVEFDFFLRGLDLSAKIHKSVVAGIANIAAEVETFLEEINASNELKRKVLELHKIAEEHDENIKVSVGLNKKFCTLQEIAAFLLIPHVNSLDEAELIPKISGEDLKKFGWDPKIHKKAFGEELKRLHEIQLDKNAPKEELLWLIEQK